MCRHDRLIRLQYFVEPNLLTLIERGWVTKQQPMCLLHYATCGAVVAQLIGSVHADSTDHLTTVFSDHMEEIVDYTSAGALSSDFEIESGVHVHGHGFDPGATFWPKLFEEGSNGPAGAVLGDIQNATCIGVKDHAGIAMPFEQGELVHNQAPRLSRW
ncbi:TPA: hypothetical protein MH093_26895 [Klebsiella pneumoniae]|nr:hypothetical protein [Klebsiella pneumoniae]